MKSEPLKNLYKALTGNGALPLAPDDPYYVEIHGKRAREDPIQDLWSRIDLSDSESVNLLTGSRGNGKSTELNKLHVVYTVPPYLNVLAPNLGRILGGNPITRWPNIHVRKQNNTPNPYGTDLMAAII